MGGNGMDLDGTATDAATAAVPGGEVIVYEASDGDIRVDVRFDRDSVWLTRQQMADLFGRDRSVVARHIRNAFSEGELDPEATSAKFAQVRSEGERTVSRDVLHFNLDVIISVGYRVKSLRGTRFRQWATQTLREHLVRGYTLNERRLAERGLREARDTLDLLSRTLKNQELVTDTGRAVLDVIGRYANTWRLLVEYDEDRLRMPPGRSPSTGVLDFDTATGAIIRFKEELMERREEKAAHLLYFTVKDHPFTDGNKRIGSLLFLLYLKQENVEHGLNPQALTALTLLIAESAPAAKDLMVRLIMNLLVEPSDSGQRRDEGRRA